MTKKKEQGLFLVEKILDKKTAGTSTRYLVKWLGYPDSENSWELKKNLKNVKSLTDAYDLFHSNKGKKKLIIDHFTYPVNKKIKQSYPDEIESIINGKIDESDKFLKFEVSWKLRGDGIKPENSIIENKSLRELDPTKLIEFYERKLKYGYDFQEDSYSESENLHDMYDI